MGRNITKEGAAILGRVLSAQMERAGLRQIDLIERLKAIDFKVSQNTISLLLNGAGSQIRGDLLSAIAALKIFVGADGLPLTTDELILIACEMIAPPEWAAPDPAQTPWPEAVRFLLQKKGDRTIEEFAEYLNLKPRELEVILSGQRPSSRQLFKFSKLFPDFDPYPLAAAYGMAEDAPLPNGDAHGSTGALLEKLDYTNGNAPV